MAAEVEAFTDWAVTAMKPTRATPTITADAVDAVRFGLRSAFSRAMRPSTPSELRERGAEHGGERRADDRAQHDHGEQGERGRRAPSIWRLPPSPPKRPL